MPESNNGARRCWEKLVTVCGEESVLVQTTVSPRYTLVCRPFASGPHATRTTDRETVVVDTNGIHTPFEHEPLFEQDEPSSALPLGIHWPPKQAPARMQSLPAHKIPLACPMQLCANVLVTEV